MDANTFDNIPAPVTAPVPTESEPDKKITVDVDAESIMAAIAAVNDEGYTDSIVTVQLERINNVVPDKGLQDYTDEDKEYIDSAELKNLSIDTYSLDGVTLNAIFTFDTKDSLFLQDLNDLCNRYRHATEELAMQNVTDKAMNLSIIIAPHEYEGRAVVIMNMPFMYTRCLADNGENASMHMMFYLDNIQFFALELTEEEEMMLKADAQRMAAEGTGGDLF